MPLTKKQLKKIEEIIRSRVLSFKFEALGERALTSEEIQTLKRAGLLKESVRSFVGDAYVLGKIASRIDRTLARDVSYDQVLKMAQKLPRTSVEKKTIQFATDHAGEYITKLSDSMVTEVRGEVARTALDTIRDEVAETIKNRETVTQLQTRLFDAIDDKNRDWRRVASTEMQSAIQQGIANDIHENYGGDQLVYKRPAPDACKHCVRLHLEDDGVTPRIFKLSDLDYSNIGRKAAEWTATIGPVHPYCQCQLHIVPEGYNFNKHKVATEAITFGGKKYGIGSIIPSSAFDSMPAEMKQKTRDEAIMEVSRKKARVSKSLSPLDLGSDIEGHE